MPSSSVKDVSNGIIAAVKRILENPSDRIVKHVSFDNCAQCSTLLLVVASIQGTGSGF